MPVVSNLLSTPYTQDDIEASPESVRSATFEQAKSDLLGPSILRSLELVGAGSTYGRAGGAYQRRYKADEATRYMDDAGLSGQFTFDRDYTEGELKALAARKRAEMQRQSILSRADQSPSAVTGRLGLQLMTSFLDPLTVATAFVPVVSGARYAKLLEGAGGALGRAGLRAGVGAAEGAVGSALVEPIIAGAHYQEQADYTLADSLLNIGIGGVLGGGLHVVGGVVGDAFRSRAAIDTVPDSIRTDEFSAQQADAALPQTQMPEFKAWFGDSKVVDQSGQPLRVFHATPREFDTFRTSGNTTTSGESLDAAFFSEAADYANEYAAVKGDKPVQVVPTYLNLRNPLEVELSPAEFADPRVEAGIIKQARDAGNDGVIFKDTDSGDRFFAAFRPEQIKSAIGNSGKFDPSSASLTDASSIVANSTPDIREAALKSAVSQAVTGQPIEARPIYDRTTLPEAAGRLNDPDQRPLSDPAAIKRADDTLAAGDAADDAAIEKQVQDLDEQFKAMQAEAELLGDEDMAAMVAAINEEFAQAQRGVREASSHAQMLATCSMRSPA